MRITKANVRVGVVGALCFLFLGVLQGCGDAITEPVNDDPPECIIINGVMHCK